MTSRKILVVDDDAAVAAEIKDQLTELKYDATTTSSSEDDVAARLKEPAPDLVLIDMPPDGSAREVAILEEFRKFWNVPVVVMIANDDEAGMRRAEMSESYGCVTKPIRRRELRVNVELAFCKHDAAEAVRDLEDRFFSTSIDMLCFLDFNGYFKRVNPAWERALGYTRKELMSRPFIDFVHPDDRERTLAQNARVRGGGQALAFENRYVCKDGSFRWLRWNAAPDTTTQVIYSVARDVTESKQVEDEREKLVQELQNALAEVNALRNILPICSYCRKIRDDENYWHTVEVYIERHTTTQFSHGICPSCMASHVEPQLKELESKGTTPPEA